MSCLTRRVVVALLLAALLPLADVRAQDVQAPESSPSRAHVEARLAALNEADASPETVAEARAAWEAARAAVDARDEWRRQAEAWILSRQEAPALLEKLRAELAAWPTLTPPLIPADAPRSALESGLAEARAALAGAEREVTDLRDLRDQRGRRRQEIPRRLADARTQLASLRGASQPAPTQPLVDEARAVLAQLQIEVLAAEIDALEAELGSHDARGELLSAREERASRVRADRQAVAALWQDRVDGRRVAEAQASAREANQAAAQLSADWPAVVREVAEANQRVAARWVELTEQLERSSGDVAAADAQLADLISRRATVQRRVDRLGFTSPLAIALRRDRDELPTVDALERRKAARRALGLAVQEDLLDWESERSELESVEAHTDRLLPASRGPEPAREALRALLSRRKVLLDEASQDAEAWSTRLLDLDERSQRIAEEAALYRRFIDEHVLWVPDAAPLDEQALTNALRGLGRLTGPTALRDLGDAAMSIVRERPGRSVLWLVALLALGALRMVTTRRLRLLAEHVATTRIHGLAPMLAAVGLSMGAALVLPGVLLVVGELLHGVQTAPIEVVCWASALGAAGWALLPVRMLAQLIRPSGVGTVHLRWSERAVTSVRRSTRPLAVLLPSLVGLAVAGTTLAGSGQHDDAVEGAALARVVTILALLVAGAFLWIVLRPGGRVLDAVRTRNPRGLAVRTVGLWWPVLWLAPVALAVSGAMGLAYAASELGGRLLATWSVLLVLLILHGVVVRWLVLTRRKLRVEQVRQRMAAGSSSGSASGDGEPGGPDAQPVPARAPAAAPTPTAASAAAPASAGVEGALATEKELDLELVDAQARRLLTTVSITLFVLAALALWSEVFPALAALERVTVWSDTPAVAGSAPAPALPMPGDDAAAPVEPAADRAPVAGRVSLADLLAALLAGAITWVALRNLPALLEVVLLGRSGVEPGLVYAIVALTRYALIVLGVIVASGLLGFSWSKIQWLVAAMTVGLGFGLQEIFANFVSGLIILFERPIRVGDIVTVGGTEGVVTRIKMRATVVRDWEWRELLVPNRNFITDQLVNWTLSDPRTRVTFPVGISYGDDTALATRLLLEIAQEHPLVLDDPKPNVLFKDFGESSLDLQLRIWIASRDQFVQVKSDVNAAIHERFAASGLTIPFPQRDLWVKAWPEDGGPRERPGAPRAADGPPEP